jgi:hypothetical protein
MEEILKQILIRLDHLATKDDINHLATKDDIASINQKLDAIMSQVALNTEQDTAFNEVATTVQDQGTDIKLIKKLLTNQ